MVVTLDLTCALHEPVAGFEQINSVALSSLANIVSSMKPTNNSLGHSLKNGFPNLELFLTWFSFNQFEKK